MNALEGRTIAISISDAPDRAKLGFPAREVERALFTVCTALIRAGARVQYAGDLRPDGWTFSMFRHMAGAYAGHHEAPFIHVIAEPVFRRTSFETLLDAARQSRGIAETVVAIGGRLRSVWLHGGGLLIEPEGNRAELPSAQALGTWLGQHVEQPKAAAFSLARRLATEASDARVAMGGKLGLLDDEKDIYEGAMPGIAEEAILALEAGIALAPLGAFGGAARDVAIALDLLPGAARVPRGRQQESYEPTMKRIRGLRSSVPRALRRPLRELAGSDRAEWVAQAVVRVLADWNRQAPRLRPDAPTSPHGKEG